MRAMSCPRKDGGETDRERSRKVTRKPNRIVSPPVSIPQTRRHKLGKAAIRSFPTEWIRKLKSTWVISKIYNKRILHDEVDVVRDE